MQSTEDRRNFMIREAGPSDLGGLLSLYLHLHETSVPADGEQLRAVWAQIMADPNHHVLVCEQDGQIVASCVCVVVPNLTRGLRPYALIENVVTHADFRRRGLATRCLDAAREIARAAGCYKLMLLTGAKDEDTLNFYRRAGFDDGEKTAFIQRLDK